MDTVSLLIELEVLKKKMDNAEAFLEELIHYIFVVCKEDDYITPEVICRKLYKYGFIDKKDGEWVADTPQTDIHGLTDCDFCKGENCEECEGGKDEPQTEDAYAYDEDDWYDKTERSE